MKHFNKGRVGIAVAFIVGLVLALLFLWPHTALPQALGAGTGTIDKLPQYIETKDEGVSLVTKTKSFNFAGAGVTATNSSGAITVTIPGSAGGGTWGTITGTLSNQTDLQAALDAKQPLDSDLTTIAGLTATTNNFLVSVASAWASRTPAQVKTTLSLDNVENTALSTWAGTSNITTLGTITTGVWNGTAIANANLANSTISGIALGSNLAALTATDATLTFSGSYTGATARTVGLNLGNANTWTAKQTFNTAAPRLGTITGSTQCLHVDTNGDITGTGSDCGSGSGGLTVGTTAIASGTTTRVLYDNAGTLGEYTISGSGNVAMTTNGVFTTPNLGTPSALTLTNATGLPIAGITGLGTGVGTWLATPSSANLITAMTDETGSGALVFGTTPTLATPVLNGTPTGTGVATAATASTLTLRDSNANITANNWLGGYTTTATAAGTTTLTVASTYLQYFTGSTTQTVTLPVVSTLPLGTQYVIVNNSTGAVTINSSGGNAVVVAAGSTSAIVTSIATSGTNAAVWSVSYAADNVASGKKATFSNTLTLAGTDGSTLNVGTGGTLGTAAYTAASAYEVPLTFSTGLTRSTNTITVNTSQNIATLSNLTSNGLVTTSGAAGTLGITAMGSGIATWLGTPSSANLASAITDETGSGKLVFATSPDFTTAITLGGVAVDTISSTASLTNKTLTSSTNVLGGVTMTLGSDADGDIYYRSGGVLTRLAKGTALQMLRMNSGATAPEWATVNIPTVPFFQQVLPMGATGTVPTTVTAAGSNSDGSLLFTMDDAFNPPGLYRWARDTNTGMYQATHMVQVTSGGGGAITSEHAIIVIGSFVYVCFDGGTNVSCERFAIADLTGEASMSFGTVIAATSTANVSGWTDGTNIYLISSTAATTTRINSISGTSFTQTGTATAAANLISKRCVSFWDGTSAYMSQSNGVNNDDTLNKLTNINGSTISSSVLNQRGKTYGSSDEGSMLVIASIDSNKMYYGYAATQFNATVVISLLQQLIPVTKP